MARFIGISSSLAKQIGWRTSFGLTVPCPVGGLVALPTQGNAICHQLHSHPFVRVVVDIKPIARFAQGTAVPPELSHLSAESLPVIALQILLVARWRRLPLRGSVVLGFPDRSEFSLLAKVAALPADVVKRDVGVSGTTVVAD
jgi:hypothetical protein